MDALTVISAVASVGAAIFALIHARRAKHYSQMASKQVASHRRISDLASLLEQFKTTYEELAPFGPSASQDSLRGKDPSVAARKVQDYLTSVTSLKSSLQISDFQKRITKLSEWTGRFSSAIDPSDMKTCGTYLVKNLSDLNAAVHTTLNRTRESVGLR